MKQKTFHFIVDVEVNVDDHDKYENRAKNNAREYLREVLEGGIDMANENKHIVSVKAPLLTNVSGVWKDPNVITPDCNLYCLIQTRNLLRECLNLEELALYDKEKGIWVEPGTEKEIFEVVWWTEYQGSAKENMGERKDPVWSDLTI